MNQEIQNFEPNDNFDEHIIDELLKQGFKGDELISAFEERKSQMKIAIDTIKDESEDVAKGKTDYYTYKDVFSDKRD